MTYSIVIQPAAEEDIEAAYEYIRTRSKAHANRWLIGLMDAINSLAIMPNRCGFARESVEFDEPIRQSIYGRRQHAYRIVFVVRLSRVHILRVLHGTRDALDPRELEP